MLMADFVIGKRDHGARTVLVLEENDIQLTNQQVVADALTQAEAERPDTPDEVTFTRGIAAAGMVG